MATPFPFGSGNTLLASQLNAITTLPINDQTASYVAVVGDVGKRLVMNVGSANTVTINNSIFGVGDQIIIANKGAGATTVTAGAGVTINTAGSLVLAQHAGGTLVFASASSATFFPTSGTSITSAIFNETQASGTNGGTSVATTFTKRTLNTTVVNNITGCSIASSVITLPAGSYIVTASAPSFESNLFKIRLQNTTDSSTAVLGTSELTGSGVVQTNGIVSGFFTITGNKNFELQHYVQSARANLGFGNPTSIASVSEVYSTIQIDKVA
jgi:hypothetical protein